MGSNVHVGDLLLDNAEVGGSESALNYVLKHFVLIIIYYININHSIASLDLTPIVPPWTPPPMLARFDRELEDYDDYGRWL